MARRFVSFQNDFAAAAALENGKSQTREKTKIIFRFPLTIDPSSPNAVHSSAGIRRKRRRGRAKIQNRNGRRRRTLADVQRTDERTRADGRSDAVCGERTRGRTDGRSSGKKKRYGRAHVLTRARARRADTRRRTPRSSRLRPDTAADRSPPRPQTPETPPPLGRGFGGGVRPLARPPPTLGPRDATYGGRVKVARLGRGHGPKNAAATVAAAAAVAVYFSRRPTFAFIAALLIIVVVRRRVQAGFYI